MMASVVSRIAAHGARPVLRVAGDTSPWLSAESLIHAAAALASQIPPLRQSSPAAFLSTPAVAVLAPRTPAYVVASLAAWMRGACVVPIMPEHPLPSMVHCLRTARVACILADPSLAPLAASAATAAATAAAPTNTLSQQSPSTGPKPLAVAPTIVPVAAVNRSATNGPIPSAFLSDSCRPRDPALVVFTSGALPHVWFVTGADHLTRWLSLWGGNK
jgi:acyl-CoA synthetase (AMP-forming)/AMP-acid ligase II